MNKMLILVVGVAGVGKTTLCKEFVTKHFFAEHIRASDYAKLVNGYDPNQVGLTTAIRNKVENGDKSLYLVDGHIIIKEKRIPEEALSFILPLSQDYPQIEKWFLSKVVPGLRSGTRKLAVHKRNEKIVALGIAKCELGEKKICTVRVAPEYKGRGLGLRVFDELMSWLGTDQPHATVSEDKLPEFQRLFDYYGYKLTSTHKGRYQPEKIEYLFNQPNRLV